MNRIVSVIVNNKPGVLNRITALFMRKGFNIQSLTVGVTETADLSRMTIVMNDTDDAALEQVMKQLYKQIDVRKVTDLTEEPMVSRELVLIQVNSPVSQRSGVTALIEPFRASIIDVSRDSITIQATGRTDKLEALIALLRPYGIRELARTGLTALARDTTGADGKGLADGQLLQI